MIAFQCGGCGQRYNVAASHGGKSFACKKCGAGLTVPVAYGEPQASGSTSVFEREGGVNMSGGGQVLKQSTAYAAPPVDTVMMPPGRRAPARAPMAPQPAPAQPYYQQPQQYAQPGYQQPYQAPMPGYQQPQYAAAPAPRMRPAGAPGTRRMMRGAPGMSPAPNPGTRSFQRNVSRATPGMAQPGMMPAAPRKKNTGLVIGLSCGGAALVIAVMIIVIVSSNGSGPAVNQTPEVANKPVKSAAELQAEKVKAQRTELDKVGSWLNIPGSDTNYGALWDRYKSVKGMELEAELDGQRKEIMDKLAGLMGDKGANWITATTKLHAEIAKTLKQDGYPKVAESIAQFVMNEQKYSLFTEKVKVVDGKQKRESVEDPDYVSLQRIAGYVMYKEPADIDEAADWIQAFPEYRKYSDYVTQARADYPEKPFPADILKKVQEYEEPLRALINDINVAHEKDGFAKYAAKAFTRFRNSYQNSHFPGVPGDWTYDYAAPFVFFLELKDNTSSAGEIKASLAQKKRILADLGKFFNEDFRDVWRLERVYPEGIPQEEKVKWPLEIVVLRDGERYQAYGKDVLNGALPPGARAHYSPDFKLVITWDNPKAKLDKNIEWFDQSVIIHESWHLISALHQKERGVWFNKDEGKNYPLPGYSSLLVQEGLTDFVAGFETDGTNYAFRKVNHLRLRSFQGLTKQISRMWGQMAAAYKKRGKTMPGTIPYEEGRYASLFDMRSVVASLTYGTCPYLATTHVVNLGLGGYFPLVAFANNFGNAMGLYYAAAAVSGYFFHYYENGKYRDKYYEWCRRDYVNEIDKNLDMPSLSYESLRSLPGITEFMKLFEIKDWDDPRWAEMTQEWLKFTCEDVEAKDVGKGYEVDDIKSEGKEPDGGGEGCWRSGNPVFEWTEADLDAIVDQYLREHPDTQDIGGGAAEMRAGCAPGRSSCLGMLYGMYWPGGGEAPDEPSPYAARPWAEERASYTRRTRLPNPQVIS